jgi:hypothetical protein
LLTIQLNKDKNKQPNNQKQTNKKTKTKTKTNQANNVFLIKKKKKTKQTPKSKFINAKTQIHRKKHLLINRSQTVLVLIV